MLGRLWLELPGRDGGCTGSKLFFHCWQCGPPDGCVGERQSDDNLGELCTGDQLYRYETLTDGLWRWAGDTCSLEFKWLIWEWKTPTRSYRWDMPSMSLWTRLRQALHEKAIFNTSMARELVLLKRDLSGPFSTSCHSHDYKSGRVRNCSWWVEEVEGGREKQGMVSPSLATWSCELQASTRWRMGENLPWHVVAKSSYCMRQDILITKNENIFWWLKVITGLFVICVWAQQP